MQMLVPDVMRGRVMAVCNTAVYGVMAFSPLLIDWLQGAIAVHTGDIVGIRLGLAFTGVIMACGGAVMLIWRTPEVDGIKPGEHGFDRQPGIWRGITGAVHRPKQ